MDVARGTTLRRRSRERGAAVFIVVMVIALLTAIGIFAARSASLVDVAAGYERLMVQTEYLSQYGTLAAAGELGSGIAAAHVDALQGRIGEDGEPVTLPDCRATDRLKRYVERTGEAQKIHCHRLQSPSIAHRLRQGPTAAELLEPAADGEPGSFGLQPLSGTFVVELTEPGELQKPIAGESAGGAVEHFKYSTVTLSGYAQLHAGAAACDDGTTATAALQAVRAYAVIGPHPK